MMRLVPWVLLVLVALLLGWLAWDSGRKQKVDEVRIAMLEATRDQALAAAGKAQAYADSAAAVADSVNSLREVERAFAEEQARRLAAEADAHAAAIGAMVPEGEVRDAVVGAVSALRATYERRLSDLHVIVDRSDAVIASLQNERVELRRAVGNLTETLEATTEQRDICMDAKGPGLWQRVRESAGPIGVALGVGLIAGLLAG